MSASFSSILYCVLLYTILYLLDSMAKKYYHVSYSRLLRYTGIELGPLQIKWFTERFNRVLLKFGRSCPRTLSVWFQLGAILASLLIPVAIYILINNLIREIGIFGNSQVDKRDQLVIQPVLPGINIPNSELGYYFFSLLLCSVYHELGHAVSAVSENIRVLGFGVIILFLIPAAYVDLPTDQLKTKSNLQKLRVFSAGVWHNIILAAFSYLILQASPELLSPLYSHGLSPCVVYVTPNSSVTGPTGLKPGDVITHMQNLPIINKTDFRSHILSSIQNPPQGICTNKKKIEELVSSREPDCCDLYSESSKSLCFQIFDHGVPLSSRCLPARDLIKESRDDMMCQSKESTCLGSLVCAVPVFSTNFTKFIQIKRGNDKEFLYVGNPALIYTSVQISDFCPRYSMLPPLLPEIMMKMLSYVMSFSAALALLNVIPSLLLDGQHMIIVLLEMLMVGRSKIYRKHFQVILTILGTFLVVVNIGIGFYRVIVSGSSNILFT